MDDKKCPVHDECFASRDKEHVSIVTRLDKVEACNRKLDKEKVNMRFIQIFITVLALVLCGLFGVALKNGDKLNDIVVNQAITQQKISDHIENSD